MRFLLALALLTTTSAFGQGTTTTPSKTYQDGLCEGYKKALEEMKFRGQNFTIFLQNVQRSDSAPYVLSMAQMTVLAPFSSLEGCK